MARFLALTLCLMSAPAFAEAPAPVAALSAQQGTVLVNTGDAFITAGQNQALKVGDRVMVMEGSSATVIFNDGCELSLAAGSIVEVPAISTCAGGIANVQQIGPGNAQAVGAVQQGGRNRAVGWVFGTAGALITWALIEGEYSIRPTSP